MPARSCRCKNSTGSGKFWVFCDVPCPSHCKQSPHSLLRKIGHTRNACLQSRLPTRLCGEGAPWIRTGSFRITSLFEELSGIASPGRRVPLQRRTIGRSCSPPVTCLCYILGLAVPRGSANASMEGRAPFSSPGLCKLSASALRNGITLLSRCRDVLQGESVAG